VTQDIFKAGTLYLAMGVEGAAALIIGLGALSRQSFER